jgi:hypothetical protein
MGEGRKEKASGRKSMRKPEGAYGGKVIAG